MFAPQQEQQRPHQHTNNATTFINAIDNSTGASLSTSAANQTESEESISGLEWILVLLHAAVFVIGLIGNCLVCLSVYRNKSLRTVTNYFIVNLAVADFLVILICLPPTVIWDVTLTWFFGKYMCKLVLYLQNISVSVSVLTLTFISLDRWYAICYPLKFTSSKSRARLAIIIIWLISMSVALPDLILLTTVKPANSPVDYVYYTDCIHSWSVDQSKIYQLCIVSLLFVIPFLIMSVSYFQIIRVLWRDDALAATIESMSKSIASHHCHHHHQTKQQHQQTPATLLRKAKMTSKKTTTTTLSATPTPKKTTITLSEDEHDDDDDDDDDSTVTSGQQITPTNTDTDPTPPNQLLLAHLHHINCHQDHHHIEPAISVHGPQMTSAPSGAHYYRHQVQEENAHHQMGAARQHHQNQCTINTADSSSYAPACSLVASDAVHLSSSQIRFCKLIRSRRKAAKMLLAVVIMFGLCYLPVHLINTLRCTISLPQNDYTTIVSLVSHWLCYFNSAINPIIYNIMNSKFRREFAKMFACFNLFHLGQNIINTAANNGQHARSFIPPRRQIAASGQAAPKLIYSNDSKTSQTLTTSN